MFSFEYQNQTKIILGNGEITRAGEQLAAFGMTRVLFVYGRASIKKNGIYDTIVKSMQEAGIEWIEWGGVSSNPLRSHVQKGIDLAREKGVNGLFAVGGGSVIDEAKAIALGVLSECDFWDYYADPAHHPITRALPVGTVLTIPATGSESNGGSVVTDDETREKTSVISPVLNPRFSIMDPELTVTVPPNYVAYSAADAISHITESYFTRGKGFFPVQDGYAEGQVKAIMQIALKIQENPRDLDARAQMMWAASMAWNLLGPVGLGPWCAPVHMLEHPMSGLYNVPHGAGIAVTEIAWLTWESRRRTDRIAAFSRHVLGVVEEDDRVACEKGIALYRVWLVKIGAPVSLRDCKITREQIPELAKHSEFLARAWGFGDDYSLAAITEILELAY